MAISSGNPVVVVAARGTERVLHDFSMELLDASLLGWSRAQFAMKDMEFKSFMQNEVFKTLLQ